MTTTDADSLKKGQRGMSALSSLSDGSTTKHSVRCVSFYDQYVLVYGLSSLLFGYSISILNTLPRILTLEFQWCGNAWESSCDAASNKINILSPMVFITAAIGALFGGGFAGYGRRFVAILMHMIFILGSAVTAFASNFSLLLVGRLMTGLGVGLVTVVAPMFISEITPVKVRGSRGVMHQFCIVVGILLGIALGIFMEQPPEAPSDTYRLSSFQSLYMRVMLGLPGVVSVFALLLLFTCYNSETPHFLIYQNRSADAVKVLREIHGRKNVDAEFKEIEDAKVAMDRAKERKEEVNLLSALGDGWYRHVIFVGGLLSIGQQISGVNAFVALSNSIFESAGIPVDKLSLASTLMALVNFVMTFPSIFLVESLGRKPLLVIGNFGQALALGIVPLCHVLGLQSALPLISAISVVCFIIFFALAYGPVLWVYLNEIFPPEIQGSAVGFSSALNWIAGIFAVWFTGEMTRRGNVTLQFAIFASTSLFMAFFCLLWMKESKGRSNANSPYMEGRVKAVAISSSDEVQNLV